mmetsp:Transcript_11199/g.18287  ORF Transcript_11199/g.18287 Transcript_11199/m.18287 type:complete len:545 (+) Transcript_11199:82-1716(+)
MTRNIRPRNLDVTKKLPIRRVQDVIFKEGGKIFSASSVSKGAAKEVSSSKKAFIPTPQVQKVKPGFKIRKEFKQPVHYLHFTNCTGAKVITEHDRYDLLQDDMEWLKKFNKNINGYLSEDDLELLMDFFEKQAWVVTKQVDPSGAYPLSQATADVVERLGPSRAKFAEHVYMHWKGQRMKLDKALMRKFQKPPPHDDSNPHVAFRLRVPETGRRVSYRNPKKNDHAGYQKMRVLRKDFDRLMEIIEHAREREHLKRNSHLIDSEIFDRRLLSALPTKIKDDPVVKSLLVACVPKCPTQRRTMETHRKRRSGTRKPRYRDTRGRTPQTPPVEISDDEIYSETDDSDREFYDNVENMLLETRMSEEGLSPRKLIPEFGFPAPHWLPNSQEILRKEVPTLNELRERWDPDTTRKRQRLEAERKSRRKNTTAKSYRRENFYRSRGRFCGFVGRGGRVRISVKRSRIRPYGLSTNRAKAGTAYNEDTLQCKVDQEEFSKNRGGASRGGRGRGMGIGIRSTPGRYVTPLGQSILTELENVKKMPSFPEKS